jgi:DNA-directed RNA polymerase sigma subunit (sigma70/sigma32)
MLIANEELLGGLVPELSKRVGRSAKRHAKGFDQVTTEELVWQVESEILELVLEKTPSRKGDFLEVAFNRGVMLQTLDAVEKYRNSMWAHSDRISEIGTVEDGEGVVHPIELIVDDRPNPLEVLLQKEEEIRLHELIEKAHDAVKDPRHLEALILRLDGWPLTDKDPSNPNLESYFGVSARQIENWIKKALKDMRAACDDSEESGDENDR